MEQNSGSGKLHGLFAPALTLFDTSGKIDYDLNLQMMKDLVNDGLSGIYFLGTSSGFWLLDPTERLEYTEFILANIPSEITCIVNTSYWNAVSAANFAHHAVNHGAKYISAVLPTYTPVDDAGIMDYYTQIHMAAPNTPLFCYHIPLIDSSAKISAPLLIEMAQKGIIQGVKNSTFDIAHMKYLLDYAPDDFTILCGTEKLMFNTAELGYKPDGWVLTLLCATPHIFLNYFNAVEKSDLDGMNYYKQGILELLGCVQYGIQYVIPATLYILNLLGKDMVETSRTPMPSLTQSMKENIKSIITSLSNQNFL